MRDTLVITGFAFEVDKEARIGGTPLQALERAANRGLACCDYIREEVRRTLKLKFGWTEDQVTTAVQPYLLSA